MKPFSFAVLDSFSGKQNLSGEMIFTSLVDEYSDNPNMNMKHVDEILKTACANGLLKESEYRLRSGDELVIFYSATEVGRKIIDNL